MHAQRRLVNIDEAVDVTRAAKLLRWHLEAMFFLMCSYSAAFQVRGYTLRVKD